MFRNQFATLPETLNACNSLTFITSAVGSRSTFWCRRTRLPLAARVRTAESHSAGLHVHVCSTTDHTHCYIARRRKAISLFGARCSQKGILQTPAKNCGCLYVPCKEAEGKNALLPACWPQPQLLSAEPRHKRRALVRERRVELHHRCPWAKTLGTQFETNGV